MQLVSAVIQVGSTWLLEVKKNLSVQKPFHEAIGCALEAVRVTLEKTLSTVSIEKDKIKKEDIELNQVAARREIMNSENADWTRFVKLIK